MNKLLIFLAFLLMGATLSFTLPTISDGSPSSLEKRVAPSDARLIKRNAKLTFYWVANEADRKSKATVTIRNCRKQVVAVVNRDFAVEMKLEGSGRGKDGTVYNFDDCSCGSGFNCFVKVDKKKFPFGIGSSGNPLVSYVSVAANDIKRGTKLYVKKLDGIKLPSGDRHNGCVRVDDTGFSFGKNQIDWFVGLERNYKFLIKQDQLNRVDVAVSNNCKILKYRSVL